jgi:hypothetical protein
MALLRASFIALSAVLASHCWIMARMLSVHPLPARGPMSARARMGQVCRLMRSQTKARLQPSLPTALVYHFHVISGSRSRGLSSRGSFPLGGSVQVVVARPVRVEKPMAVRARSEPRLEVDIRPDSVLMQF